MGEWVDELMGTWMGELIDTCMDGHVAFLEVIAVDQKAGRFFISDRMLHDK